MTDAYDPGTDGAVQDFSAKMSYSDYLSLDPVLTAQHPRSTAHDELLFIIQHQTSELWMRLVIHELGAARDLIARGSLPEAFKMLSRVARIFDQLNGAWDVLRTMTPSDYTTFRETLGASSGFQSWQYRMIEFMLGNRNTAMMKPHAHLPEITRLLEAELAQPSLYAVALGKLFEHLGKPKPRIDQRAPHQAQPVIEAAWQEIYVNPSAHWALYDLAEKLVDLEDFFRRWRFNHVTTVERVIGFKRGTGGTAGVSYLRRMLEIELFPELWHVRGKL